MTRYTEFIRANANKTEKEQLVSLMEKFNISVDDAMDALTEELGGITNSDKFDDSYWEIVFESNKNTHRYGANYENLGDDW